MYIQVLDSAASQNTYEIKYRGVTPNGDKEEAKFDVTLVSGPAPAGYSGCPSFVDCATSVDALSITTAQVFDNKSYKIEDSIVYLTVDEMSEDGASC
jgi:hypothetical protein